MNSQTLTVEDLRCLCCADDVVVAVERVAGVAHAGVDYQRGLLTVEFGDGDADEAAVRAAVNGAGYRCEGQPGRVTAAQLAHTAQMAAITCGTTCDRMQYELPHTAAAEVHRHPTEAAAGKHAGMDHDMSDPAMAVAMERDMRRRFFIALALTIPVILFSPIAVNSFGLELVGSQDARNWIMLVLSAPIVWYAGWIFIGGAWTSLRNRAMISTSRSKRWPGVISEGAIS